MQERKRQQKGIQGLNWTFMELKSESKIININGKESLNWTFMELKLSLVVVEDKNRLVWIEPLWNWNLLARNTSRFQSRLNWTFMELKWRKEEVAFSCSCRLNWTFMELKLDENGYYEWWFDVWIEPLWNWNITLWFFNNSSTLFELNLYGIEIHWERLRNSHCASVWIEPLWNWNCSEGAITDVCGLFELNLYGIEMKQTERTALVKTVWIEPLWNWNRLTLIR